MIRKVLVMFGLVIISSFSLAAIIPQPAMAATDCDKKGMILTLKPWYYKLTNTDCSIKTPADMSTGSENNGMQQFITRIILTVVEDLLQIVAYATVAFIIYGGFLYMTSSGAPDKAARGQKTVLNAAIGLFIAIASIGLVNFVGGALGL